MFTVTLWHHIGAAIVVSHPSGVTYENQVAGTECRQASLEGVLVPIANDVLTDTGEIVSPENDLKDFFLGPKHMGVGAGLGLDENDADVIDGVMDKYRCDWVRVDRSRLKLSCEAWVHIELDRSKMYSPEVIWRGHESKRGVLTWSNSD